MKGMHFSLRGGKPPLLLRFRSSPALIITTCAFAVYTDIFLFAVLVPVLPFSLSERAHVRDEKVQYWVSVSLSIFGAAILVSSPLWGYLADRTPNRKGPMVAGLILLAACSLLICLGKSLTLILLGRALQGLSAALTWTVGLALIVDSVDRDSTGQATGWIGTALSLGLLTGPLLGGVVYDKGGFYQVFYMCFGLIALDIFLRFFIIEAKDAKKWWPAHDREGHAEEAALEERGNPSPRRSHPEAAEAIHRVDDRLDQIEMQKPSDAAKLGRLSSQPGEKASQDGRKGPSVGVVSLLRKPRLLAALWGTLVEGIVQTGLDSVLPLFTADLFGWNSTGGGLILLPLVLPSFLSPLIGRVADRYGSKWLSTVGYLILTPFLICLRFVTEDSMAHKVMLCALLAGVGVGDSMVLGPLMAETSWAIEEDLPEGVETPYALAYGLYNMAFSGGCLVGPLLAGFIRDSQGWPTVGWVMGLFAVVSAVVQFTWTGKPVKWKWWRRDSDRNIERDRST